MRDTQRGSQGYMEKRRGSRDIEVTRRRRGGIKRGENKLARKESWVMNWSTWLAGQLALVPLPGLQVKPQERV